MINLFSDFVVFAAEQNAPQLAVAIMQTRGSCSPCTEKLGDKESYWSLLCAAATRQMREHESESEIPDTFSNICAFIEGKII